MEKHLLKKELSGLLSMTNNLPRLIEEMEKILYDLGHNWEDKKPLYMGCWRGCDFYISGNKQDAEEFEKFMKRAEKDRDFITELLKSNKE